MAIKTEELSFVSMGLSGSGRPVYGRRVIRGPLLHQDPMGLWRWLTRQIGAAVAHHFHDRVLHTVGVVVTGIPAQLAKALVAWLPADPAEAERLCRRWHWCGLEQNGIAVEEVYRG